MIIHYNVCNLLDRKEKLFLTMDNM